MSGEESAKEPLEGLHITDYDATSEKVTIELHGSLLRYLHTHPDKMQVLLERLARAIGKSVSSVEVQPRQGTQ